MVRNIVLIICDTLRQDYVGCYGGNIYTPSIDMLAKEGVMFTHFLPASFPTGPFRKDILTGRFTFTYHSWRSNWQSKDYLITDALNKAGFVTALIGDTMTVGSFDSHFQYVDFIKGQGPVSLYPLDIELPLPADENKLRTPRERLQVLMEQWVRWQGEEDRFAPRVFKKAHQWLENFGRKAKRFFLMIDSFDPHEPWNPPRYYIERYDSNYEGDELFEPAYAPSGYASEREIQHMRAMYAGEVTMVDRWLGFLLEGLKYMDLWDDTAIILTSDHGFYHGEHGLIGKVELDRNGTIIKRWPLYDTITRIPLIVRIPGGPSGKMYDSLCQAPDLTVTLYDLARLRIPDTCQGCSLLPVINGEKNQIRNLTVTSHTYITDKECRCPSSIRTKEWLYIYGGDEWQHELYNLREDPIQKNDVFDEEREIAKDLHQEYINWLKEMECPEVSIHLRSKFNDRPREDLPYAKTI
ncbi:MAG: sulfatase family protein [bacterium]